LNDTDITSDEVLSKHAPWVEELKEKHTFTKENAAQILKEEVGQVFARCWNMPAFTSAPKKVKPHCCGLLPM